MQAIFFTKKIIRGRLLKATDMISRYNTKDIVYVDINDYFNLNKWNTFPNCILIDESSLFSHLVSYCISNEISIGVISSDEVEQHKNKNVIIDFESNTITTTANDYVTDKNTADFDLNTIQTIDGTKIEIYSTIKNLNNAILAKQLGIKSAGLVCTEFFQFKNELYENCMQSLYDICRNFYNGISSIRLFDYDENKCTNFMKNERGVRSYRIEKFNIIIEKQLRACAEISQHFNIEIVIPFVTNIDDIIFIQDKLNRLNVNIPICSMIENPASFFSASQFSDYVKSFSIGTNDLMQYFFAFNRDSISIDNNYINPYSKSLINFFESYPKEIINKTRVCGQLPIYPYMLQTLIQLGFRKFSLPSPMIPYVAKKIKRILINENFAHDVKNITNDKEVKEYIERTMLK